MKILFDILFEIEFSHEYFKNKTVPGLTILPSTRTKKIFDNYGLRYKPTNKGLLVFYEVDTADNTNPPLKPVTGDDKFVFEIYMADDYFVNYTSIPLTYKAPNILYFNNLTENIVGSNLLLNVANFVSDQDVVNIRPDYIKIEQDTTHDTSLIGVFDATNQLSFSKQLVNFLNVPTGDFKTICPLNFKDIGEGRYDIHYEGTLLEKIYTHQYVNQKKLMGVVEIFKSADVPSSYTFSDGTGAVTQRKYSIRFDCRRSTWRYFIVLKELETDPGLSIDYGAKETGEEIYPNTVSFNPSASNPQLESLYGTGRVLTFESDTELPFYQVAKKNIALNRPGTPSAEEVVGDLPNAGLQALKTNELNTHTFSEIYVYV
jgi:hypothetical protein